MKKLSSKIQFFWIIMITLFSITSCECNTATVSSKKNEESEITLRFAKSPKSKPRPEFKSLSNDEILTKYKEYYNKLGFSKKAHGDILKLIIEWNDDYGKIVPTPFEEPGIARRSPVYDDVWDTVMFEVYGSISMGIDGQNGRLRWLRNETLYWRVKTINPLPMGSVKSAKTKEEIIQIAEKYRQLAMGDFPKEMTYAKPEAKFYSDDEYSKGQWEVVWQRLINGYKVWGDSIRVTIYDKFASELGSFSDGLKYESCLTDVKINEKEAERIAWAALEWIRKEYNMQQLEFTRVAERDLLIVTPYYNVDADAKARYVELLHNRKTRLAYVFRFYCKTWGCNTPEIQIDAATGEVLGISLPG